ncbi:platelet basic protein [Castor canadensis]|uniref:Platelet basic protein n=1 Tax=Castor canadensis TaxID=51338 RepID=A0A250YMY5_CASCN|nr:platelet basic protein [Castor canadensis]
MSLRLNATSSCTSATPLHIAWVLLLLSLLLTALIPSATGQPEIGEPYFELRCACVNTVSGIHPTIVQTLKMIKPGAHCEKVQVIATLKNGKEICLDPEAPAVKKMIRNALGGH